MPTHKYLVITNSDDAHVPMVQRHLDEPFVVIDPAKILQGDHFSYLLLGENLQVRHNGRLMEGVVSVWYRKPELPAEQKLPVPEYLQGYSHHALRNFTALLRTRFPEALWVSDYYAIWRASDKSLQLELAARLGFNVPNTIVTSSSAEAKRFVDKQRGDTVIVKPIEARSFVLPDGTPKEVLARRVPKAELNYDGLHLAPSIFQQAIDREADMRVAVVGDKVFAATLRVKRGDKRALGVCDWSAHILTRNLVIEAIELPPALARLCVLHVRELGLNFGELDLMLDTKGKYWFIENNPNGQWGFVEHVTGQPIGKAMAELLMRGKV